MRLQFSSVTIRPSASGLAFSIDPNNDLGDVFIQKENETTPAKFLSGVGGKKYREADLIKHVNTIEA